MFWAKRVLFFNPLISQAELGLHTSLGVPRRGHPLERLRERWRERGGGVDGQREREGGREGWREGESEER